MSFRSIRFYEALPPSEAEGAAHSSGTCNSHVCATDHTGSSRMSKPQRNQGPEGRTEFSPGRKSWVGDKKMIRAPSGAARAWRSLRSRGALAAGTEDGIVLGSRCCDPMVAERGSPESYIRQRTVARVSAQESYVSAIRGIRNVAAALSQRIATALPEYTDHSVVHMDSLWQVADQVLTRDEISRFTPGEAFLLASSFYVHDLGMALPATGAGKEEIRKTDAYRGSNHFFHRLPRTSVLR